VRAESERIAAVPQTIPSNRETFDALTVDDGGLLTYLAADPLPDSPGFSGYLVPFYTLSDRGTYFVPGAFKKSAKEQLGLAPHLWMHEDWSQPIGKHAEAYEDDKGFRIRVEINEEIPEGAQTLSNLRFGTPLGLSVGFTRMADRSGTEADDAKLDRRTAPDYFKNVPINELRAITLARWWESSSVVFGAISTARPDTIHAAGGADELTELLAAIKAGSLTPEQTTQITDLVAAYEAFAAAGTSHGTNDDEARPDRRSLLTRIAAVSAHAATLGDVAA
jgi:HK97 family phage prohead protease